MGVQESGSGVGGGGPGLSPVPEPGCLGAASEEPLSLAWKLLEELAGEVVEAGAAVRSQPAAEKEHRTATATSHGSRAPRRRGRSGTDLPIWERLEIGLQAGGRRGGIGDFQAARISVSAVSAHLDHAVGLED